MAPRSKKTESIDETEFSETFDQNRFLILPGSLTKDSNVDRQLVKLRHPQTSELAVFVYSEKDNKLAQMRSLPFDHRTIFKNNEVIPIDRIDFVTLVDPLFILLPYFVKYSTMFSPLDQILTDEDFSELNNQLIKLSKLSDLLQIANKKESGDLVLWQYNESKTLEWLSPKVEKVTQVLVTQQINVNPNAAISSNFKLSASSAQSSAEQYKRFAYSIVSEYLPLEVQKLLQIHLGLPEKVECIKRKADGNGLDVNKKVKHDNINYDEMPNKVEKIATPKITAKDKALKKAASGTKSISSFFKKK